jgi:hypothetical protein
MSSNPRPSHPTDCPRLAELTDGRLRPDDVATRSPRCAECLRRFLSGQARAQQRDGRAG